MGGAPPPWGLAGANETWISLQSDSDWREIRFHLKLCFSLLGDPLRTASGARVLSPLAGFLPLPPAPSSLLLVNSA